MVLMYAINSKTNDRWKHVNVIIWGGFAKIISTDSQLETEILKMINYGVSIEACKDCCDNFGVTDKLIGLGTNVIY